MIKIIKIPINFVQPSLLSSVKYISTVGEVISTIAAVLALEEELQEESNNKNMQKQIDNLTNEMKKLKQQINNEKPRRS